MSAKNHAHSVHNPYSQFRKHFTIEEILAAPPITYPITLPMCAPLLGRRRRSNPVYRTGPARIGADRKRCIRIAASVIRSFTHRRLDQPELHIGRLAAQQAYAQAGLGPQDMHVAELHDASAMGEIIQAENLGLAAPGCGGPAAERGDFTLGGRIPINTSGGLESKGHPLGATGLGQLYELVTQLRGEAGAPGRGRAQCDPGKRRRPARYRRGRPGHSHPQPLSANPRGKWPRKSPPPRNPGLAPGFLSWVSERMA